MNAGRLILVSSLVVLASCASDGRVTYWQDDSCVEFSVGRSDVRWCISSVSVRESGELEVQSRWRRIQRLSGASVDKGSDAGNRNMYLRDDLGNRYDHVETSGAAATASRLDRYHPSALGVFVFPPPHPEATRFVFHDDDQNIAIENIVLQESMRTDPTTSAARLRRITDADSILVRDDFAGHDDFSSQSYRLEREGGRWVVFVISPRGEHRLETSVPLRVVDALVRELRRSPLLDREYQPAVWPLSYGRRTVSVHFDTYAGAVIFYSTSDGRGMMPWAVEAGSKTYVIPDGTPARALKWLEPVLPEFHISLPDERPDFAPEVLSTGDTPLIDAMRRGNVLEVRALILGGADVDARDPWGRTALYWAMERRESDELVQITRDLLAAGADPGAAAEGGSTPLSVARTKGHTRIVALFEGGR